jgi:hypothetical protein
MGRITKLRKISWDVSKAVKKIPGIIAIASYGSVAEGHVDKFSDINLIAFCSRIPTPSSRRKFLEKSYDWIVFDNDTVPKWRSTAQDFFFVRGEHVDITYKTKRSFDIVAKEIEKDHRVGRDLFKEVMMYVYNTRVLHDPKKVITLIRSKLPRATPQMLKYFLPDINKISMKGTKQFENLQHAISERNYLYVDNIVDLNVENFIISLYVLNGKHYTSPKWAMKSIRKFKIKPTSTTQRLQEIARLGNSPIYVKRKINLLQSLVSDLDKLILKERVFDIVN